MGKIEFIDGEKYCRYDGILCDPEGCKLIYGYEEDLPFIDDVTIVMGDTLYTDHDLAGVISSLSIFQGDSGRYDEIINGGRGFIEHSVKSRYDNSYIMPENNFDCLKGVKNIKPFSEFKKNYPEINLDAYDEFQRFLDEFYDNL